MDFCLVGGGADSNMVPLIEKLLYAKYFHIKCL